MGVSSSSLARSAWRWYLALGGVATIVYFSLATGSMPQAVLYNVVGLSAAVAIVVGVRLHRPANRLPWYLIAGGQLALLGGDVIWNVYEFVFHVDSPFPSFADALYLTGPPLVFGGLVVAIRLRRPGGDRPSLIDASLLTVGAWLLAWTFVMAPYARDPTLAAAEKVISIAYPLMDVFLLGLWVRFLVSPGDRTASNRAVSLSLVSFLVADAIYGVLILNDAYASGHAVDTGWIASYVLWGVAALHPTMVRLCDRAPRPQVRASRRRLVVLGAASLTAPALLLVQHARGVPIDATPLGVGAAVMFVLVVLRMEGLVADLDRSKANVEALSRSLERRVRQRTAELAQANASLDRSVRELRRLDELKSDFVSTVSHELRTPLTAITGFTETLAKHREALTPDLRELMVERMRVQAARLDALIAKLLDFSRLERGRLRVVPAPTRVAPVVDGVVASLEALLATHEVCVKVPRSAVVMADPDGLGRILENLLTNAQKFSQPGSRITVTAAREGSIVTLRVEDQGEGIPAHERERIFERFYRLQRGDRMGPRGTGVGLALAREYAKAQGGRLWVEEALGGGSVFVLTLRCAETPRDRSSRTSNGARTSNGRSNGRSNGSGTPPGAIRASRARSS